MIAVMARAHHCHHFLVALAADYAVAAELLGVLQCPQGRLVEAGRCGIVRRHQRYDARARRNVARHTRPRVMDGQISNPSQHHLGQLGSLCEVQTCRQRGNLILVESPAQIAGAAEAPADHARRRERLRIFSKRARLMNYSITLCTSCAAAICLVIIALFGGVLLEIDLSQFIAVLFVLAMLSLFSALVYFLREILIATRSLRIGATTDPILDEE